MIWDLRKEQRIAAITTQNSDGPLAFGGEMGEFLAWGEGKDIVISRWQPTEFLKLASRFASRNMNIEEWLQYLKTEAYHTTISTLPTHASVAAWVKLNKQGRRHPTIEKEERP